MASRLVLLASLAVCFHAMVSNGEDVVRNKANELKNCFGIQQWIWMTKMNSRADIEGCVRRLTGTSNPAPYLTCIGLRTGWYKGRTGTFRSSGDNLQKCLVESETFCPKRAGKREMEDEEEVLDVEARGFLFPWEADEIDACLGTIANKFLTKTTSRDGFNRCVKSVCPLINDGAINGVAGCIGLASGMGPGPKCKWMDFANKQQMMIMNNRGKLGRCIRDQRQRCKNEGRH